MRRALPALALTGLVSCSGGGTPERPVPHHVLFVLVDTLRADHLGCYGHPRNPTPAMDSVAAGGVRFERAIAQGSWTAPSMVAVMTGRYLAEERLDVPAQVPTIAQSFERAGWATGGFIMNDIVKEEAGFAKGFDTFLQMVPYSDNEPIEAWIEEHADVPTFTYVHLNEAHDPYLPPEEYRRWLDEPDSVSADRRRFYETVHAELELADDLDASIAHIERELGGYVDDVGYTDMRIAGLLASLARAGVAERACVVVTSDHGEGLWTREAFMTGQRGTSLRKGEAPTLVNSLMPTHGNQVNYELIRVPLLLRSPGLSAGAVVDVPVESIDLFPTLLELCDLPVPDGLQGRSAVPLIDGRGAKPRDAFSMTRFNATLVSPDGWQLILPTPLGECQEGIEVELYHLAVDPEARDNVAAGHAERVRDMSAEAVRRRESGIPGSSEPPSAATLKSLHLLGYGPEGAGILEEVREELLAKPTGELITILAGSGNCLARLEAANALAERELTDVERTAIRGRLDVEGSGAVKAALERALGAAGG